LAKNGLRSLRDYAKSSCCGGEVEAILRAFPGGLESCHQPRGTHCIPPYRTRPQSRRNGNRAHLNKDSALSFAALLAGCREKPAAPSRRPATGIASRTVQGDLSANWATVRARSRTARCAETLGTALPRRPSNHTKGLARESQVEFQFRLTK